MRSSQKPSTLPFAFSAITFALAVACGGADTEPSAEDMGTPAAEAPATAAAPAAHSDATLSDADRAAIEDVRGRVSSLTNPDAAIAGGFAEQYPAGCASSAEGGQGFHYLNQSRVDATINVQEPELVMYEPQADGSFQLVGIDYIIPFDQWTAAEPPTLLGRPLMRNEPLSVWALHIWTHRENPNGMFAAWNPNVSCEHAR